MKELTLKRLMELSGVDMNLPKVTTLLESDQQVTKIVQEIEDELTEYAHEHGEASGGDDLAWEPPAWRSGRDLWNEVLRSVPAAREARDQLEHLIGHDKVTRLIVDIANSVFDETQQDTSRPPYLG